ncbi:MAG: hypothetical protein AAB510_02740 [Patescibacteria group bacterium]
MTWALKRQIFYISILVVFFAGAGFLIARPYFNKPPTCTDGKQNGTELGVDCDGSCVKACLNQVDEVSVLWSRAFKIVPGRYNVVAYLLNHNENTGARKVGYRFRFADKDNVYIGKREGTTLIPPSGNFAVFEPGVDVGNSIPVYVTFEFTTAPVWEIIDQEKIDQIKVLVSNISLTGEENIPKLSATVRNKSLFTIPGVSLVTILYDADHNAVSTSRTYLEVLKPEESLDVNFTWREPFTGKVVAKEIIPMFSIFNAELK